MEFFSQDYWSGLPCPSAGDIPDPGINPRSNQADSLLYEPTEKLISRYIWAFLLKISSWIIFWNKPLLYFEFTWNLK